MVHIEKSIELFNARKEKANAEAGRPLHYNTLNSQKLGMMLYEGSEYQSIAVSMHNLNNGKVKTIRFEWIDRICKELDVDPNFLFGFKSVYDKEYSKLCKK